MPNCAGRKPKLLDQDRLASRRYRRTCRTCRTAHRGIGQEDAVAADMRGSGRAGRRRRAGPGRAGPRCRAASKRRGRSRSRHKRRRTRRSPPGGEGQHQAAEGGRQDGRGAHHQDQAGHELRGLVAVGQVAHHGAGDHHAGRGGEGGDEADGGEAWRGSATGRSRRPAV